MKFNTRSTEDDEASNIRVGGYKVNHNKNDCTKLKMSKSRLKND
jgi:hypothetical protein